MYGQGMYGPGPMYGVYGYDPRAGGEAGQMRGRMPERETAPVKFTEGKLFIGGVEANIISKDDLVAYCSQWGEVADAVVMDRKGYGFVTFADPKHAMKFLEKREHELKGRRLDAKAAVPKAHLGTAKLTNKMFVGGTGDLTDEDFREHFSQFGEIQDAAVVRREGMSRGFGFVTFADEISVEKCLLVNHYIKGRKVELKRAVPKEDLGTATGPGGAGPSGLGPAYAQHPPQLVHPQQQYYPYPYGPAAYGMRPGAYPPAAAMPPMAGDPYAAWYGMGYMPYYHPGMYPYGMVPQPGVPYGGVSYVPPAGIPPAATGLAPGVTAARVPAAAGAVAQEEAPFLQSARPGAQIAGPYRGPGRPFGPPPAITSGVAPVTQPAAGGEHAAGPSTSRLLSQQQQRRQQQEEEPRHAASLAGPVSTPEPAAAKSPSSSSTGGAAGAGRGTGVDISPSGSSPGGPQQQRQQLTQPGNSTAAAGGSSTTAHIGSSPAVIAAAVPAVPAAAVSSATLLPTGPLVHIVPIPPVTGPSAVAAAAAAAAGTRRPVVMSYPVAPNMMRPPPLPLPPRGMMGQALQPPYTLQGGPAGSQVQPGVGQQHHQQQQRPGSGSAGGNSMSSSS